jgi:two-component system NtrC family sensor kinase
LQASELAEQIESLSAQRDTERLGQSARLIQSSFPTVSAVRIWQNEDGAFFELASSGEEVSEQPIETVNQADLRAGRKSESEIASGSNTIFRALAPLREANGKIFGAVEVTQTLASPWSIAAGYAESEIGLAAAAVVLITITVYVLFRLLIYRPIGLLTSAMEQAESGNLSVQAPISAHDELGKVIAKFNRMVAALHEMTKEREAHQQTLQTRVFEATEALQEKNEQLSEANRELWQMSRKLSEIERLAAAGQTAAQFAHEVGTPLNLISGHVQLLRRRFKDEADERIEIILEQIERIERIVRQMLDRTRIAKNARDFAPHV